MVYFLVNVLWFLTIGIWLWAFMFIVGLLFMCSIVGIPIGVICMKKAQEWAFPFGKSAPAAGPAVYITNVQNKDD